MNSIWRYIITCALFWMLPAVSFGQTQGNQGPNGPGWMGGYGCGMMGGGMFGWMFMLLFWVILFGFLGWLATHYTQHQRRSTSHSALEILQRRYAQGEINTEEFQQKKKDLLA